MGQAVAFSEIIADAKNRLEVVARFLAVLILFRQKDVQYKQEAPYSPLYLRWVGDNHSNDDLEIREGDFA